MVASAALVAAAAAAVVCVCVGWFGYRTRIRVGVGLFTCTPFALQRWRGRPQFNGSVFFLVCVIQCDRLVEMRARLNNALSSKKRL